ncbi:subtilisin-chymotrypsin inhibitor-2B-like [Lytechinus variegatus]|uniref:subtilisin-chymotrypsin inhibitor-2B-like n=1 Tax=Lytechinus variegatus TaxID=7654 RepID=UPI001BB0E2A6|nr:subtilisin-chymotrypsin inhibitor-2B-like [Lytechinus variegatus]XP_041454391.1 subtilisin-chymotrypsin inhibitor-2B-like [Lytechinus variegatus]XP_041454398.1 subtilisin-chymotrypsin inhibitor-2B-like [Lytechinus variegatus]XP_041454407.1 subtilisin-chymotrypsin inhibitor-2B-like [Lytechinus variegatus]XP_041454415.1 subtilisin-chymotrypsin inhibitor-2B-like [Lytechinus variegatus]
MKGPALYTLLPIVVLTSVLLVPACATKSNKMASQKTKWAELVGKTGEEAKAVILQERPGLNVQILPEDSMMTADFCQDRVRILVDGAKKVVKAPSIG